MVKRAIIRTLVFVVFMTFLMWGIQPSFSPGPAQVQAASMPANGVIVYQFHRRFRCDACHDLQAAINETIKAHFAEELDSGKLVFEVIDLDAEGNEHYSEAYDFFYNTVIMVDRENGKQVRFKNLEEVWDLTDKKNVTMEFIRKHIAEYL